MKKIIYIGLIICGILLFLLFSGIYYNQKIIGITCGLSGILLFLALRLKQKQ